MKRCRKCGAAVDSDDEWQVYCVDCQRERSVETAPIRGAQPDAERLDDGVTSSDPADGVLGRFTDKRFASKVVALSVVGIAVVIVIAGASTAFTTGLFGTVDSADFVADSDDDGVSDSRELELGADPGVADTDGDGLVDGWEVDRETPAGIELAGAEPVHRDLYVTVVRAAGVAPPTADERDRLRMAFDSFDVSNPDNETGIHLHLRVRDAPVERDLRLSVESTDDLARRVHEPAVVGERFCVDSTVALGTVTEDAAADPAADGNPRFAFVDGARDDRVRTIADRLVADAAGVDGPAVSATDDGLALTESARAAIEGNGSAVETGRPEGCP